MDAIVLARVSTKEQESIPAQLSRLQPFIERQNLNVVKIFEIQESSSQDTRKEYEKMLEFVRGYWKTIAIVVDTIDRLQRSYRESVELGNLLKNGIIELHFFRESLILNKNSNSSDLMRWDLGVMLARGYVLQLSDNVKRSIDKKIEDGEYPAPAPLGYINVDMYGEISTITNRRSGKKNIIPDPNKAHYIKRIYERYATGSYSLKKLAREINEEGFRTKKGDMIKTSSLDKILKNPFYKGYMEYRGKVVPHRYEKIISEDLYNACKNVRIWLKRPEWRDGKMDFTLKGVVKCHHCQRLLSIYYSKRAKTNYIQCHTWRCLHIREDVYLEQISKVLSQLNMEKHDLEAVYEKITQKYKAVREYEQKNKKTYTDRISKLQMAINNAYEDKCLGSISEDLYVSSVAKWKAEESQLLEKIQGMTSQDKSQSWSLNYLLDLSQKAYELFKCSKIHEKREILEILFSTLEWDGKKLIYKIKEPLEEILFCGGKARE